MNVAEGIVHRCKKYINARGEIIDPAKQSGIGCVVCCPPKGRVNG